MRTIAGGNTTLDDSINGITVDAAGNIYVSQDDSVTGGIDTCAPVAQTARITVFGPGANGNVAPVAQIVGALTLLSEPNDLFADSSGKIWTSDGDAHAVYAFPVIGAATGNINEAPSVTLNGAAVAGGDPSGIAIDETGHIYVTDSGDNVNPTSIYVFAPGATGAAAPTATITGIATLLGSAYGVRAGGGFIYVADAVGGGAGLLVFKTTDTGNVAPTRQIVGATTTLTEPEGVSF